MSLPRHNSVGFLRRSRSGVFWFLLLSIPLFGYWLSNGVLLPRLQHVGWVYLIDAMLLLSWPALVWLCMPKLDRPTRDNLGLTPITGQGVDLILGTLLCVVVFSLAVLALHGLSAALLWRWDWIARDEPRFLWRRFIPPGFAGFAALTYLAVTAGIVEELYFRGLLKYVAWRRIASKKRARTVFISVSGCLFGAIHWEGGLVSLVATTLFGFIAARVYLRLGTLWPLIVAHIAIDLMFL